MFPTCLTVIMINIIIMVFFFESGQALQDQLFEPETPSLIPKCFQAYRTTDSATMSTIASRLGMTYQMFYICNANQIPNFDPDLSLKKNTSVCADCSDIRGGCDKYLIVSHPNTTCASISIQTNMSVQNLESLNPQLNCSDIVPQGTNICHGSSNCLEIHHLPVSHGSQLTCKGSLRKKDSEVADILRCNAFVDCGELQPGTSICLKCNSAVNPYSNLVLPSTNCDTYHDSKLTDDTCNHIKSLYNVSDYLITRCSSFRSKWCSFVGGAKLCVRCIPPALPSNNLESSSDSLGQNNSPNVTLISVLGITAGLAILSLGSLLFYMNLQKRKRQFMVQGNQVPPTVSQPMISHSGLVMSASQYQPRSSIVTNSNQGQTIRTSLIQNPPISPRQSNIGGIPNGQRPSLTPIFTTTNNLPNRRDSGNQLMHGERRSPTSPFTESQGTTKVTDNASDSLKPKKTISRASSATDEFGNPVIKVDKGMIQSLIPSDMAKSLDVTIDSKKQDITGASSVGEGTSTYIFEQNVNTAVSLPGYKVVKYGVDFVVPSAKDQAGDGLTAAVYRGKLIGELAKKYPNIDTVAVKVMQSPDPNSRYSSSSFNFEVAMMSSVPEHPSIVKLIGFCDKPIMAIVMKNYDTSLNDLMFDKSGKHEYSHPSPYMVLKIAYEVVSGLSHLHKHGVLHLDLKPHNILFDFTPNKSDFRCVLCDFGFANVIEQGSSKGIIVKGLKLPSSGGFTYKYAAPEVFTWKDTARHRMNAEIHRKVDVFAFAVTMYEVIMGVEAWDNVPTNQEIMNLIIKAERPKFSPESLSRYLPIRKIFPLIEKCWDQVPENRPECDEIMLILMEMISTVKQSSIDDVSFTTSIARLQDELRKNIDKNHSDYLS